MLSRRETPHPPINALTTGHFREDAAYATWRPRGTEDYLLVVTLSGSGRFGYTGGEAVVTSPGDITLLRPGTQHDYGTAPGAQGWELLWAHFLPRPHWLPHMHWPEAAPGLMRLAPGEIGEAREQIEAALWRMYRSARGALPERELFALNALEEALLWCHAANPRREEARLDPRVQAAMQFFLENLPRPVTITEAAKKAGLSSSRLAHLFRQQTGLTPQQFIEQERLARARQLLSLTGRAVNVIAKEVGFENPFYFTLRFKKQTGFAPRDWRKREQQEE